MSKKCGLLTAGLCCCVSMLVWSQYSEAGIGRPGKVTICHKADSEKYFQITVSTRALPAHLQHGDCVMNDDLACTVDSCDRDLGCIHAPDNETCDDGDACTADSCDPASGCVNTAISCDDGNLCTTDSCDPASGCQYADNIVCGDGLVCPPEQCESDADCAVGFFCNDCICTEEQAPECNGATCLTFISCNPTSGCTDPVCATTDAGGVCLEGATACSGLAPCTTSADCTGAGDKCAIDTCCGGGVCVPTSIRCEAAPTAVVPTAPVKTKGRTIAARAN